jgi:hypothetical protein
VRSPSDRVEADLRDYARLQVRAGLLTADEMVAEVAEAIAAELPGLDAAVLARAWLAAERRALIEDQQSWPEITDHDRLQAALGDLESAGCGVLQGCEDHWSAQALLRESGPMAVVWFTPGDVWHAVDHGMLEVNVWHGTGANIAPGDALLDQVIATFAQHGLASRYDEGRVEVDAHWHRRTS